MCVSYPHLPSLPPCCISPNRNEIRYSVELQTWPRRSPNSSSHHRLARIPSREEGRTVSSSCVPVVSSRCLQGRQLSVVPTPADLCQPSRPHRLQGWQASDHSSASQKGQQPLSLLIAGSDRWIPEFTRPNDFISLNTCMRAVNGLTVLGNLPSRRQLLQTKNQKGAERQKASKPQRRLWKWTIMIH